MMQDKIIDMRRAEDKRGAISMIYRAIGFEGEAGTNLDALYDVLTAWGMPVRVSFLYWNGFKKRLPTAAEGISAVCSDAMSVNRNIVFAYKKRT